MPAVTVQTGSRLHFGLSSLNPGAPDRFAGIGVMVNDPAITVRAAESDRDVVVCNSAVVADRVRGFLRILRRELLDCAPVRVEVDATANTHCGLGSGTQLALATAACVTAAVGRDWSVLKSATILGRGRRSAVGIHGFIHGGFILDGGHRPQEQIGRLAERVLFPERWRWVLVTPPDTVGLSGERELAAFRDLPTMPRRLTERLLQIAQRDITPAIRRADHQSFATALSEYGTLVGEFFAPAQGGFLGSAQARALENSGVDTKGMVQSSWGPTVCVPRSGPSEADDLVRTLSELGFDCTTVSARNCGATLKRDSAASLRHD